MKKLIHCLIIFGIILAGTTDISTRGGRGGGGRGGMRAGSMRGGGFRSGGMRSSGFRSGGMRSGINRSMARGGTGRVNRISSSRRPQTRPSRPGSNIGNRPNRPSRPGSNIGNRPNRPGQGGHHTKPNRPGHNGNYGNRGNRGGRVRGNRNYTWNNGSYGYWNNGIWFPMAVGAGLGLAGGLYYGGYYDSPYYYGDGYYNTGIPTDSSNVTNVYYTSPEQTTDYNTPSTIGAVYADNTNQANPVLVSSYVPQESNVDDNINLETDDSASTESATDFIDNLSNETSISSVAI